MAWPPVAGKIRRPPNDRCRDAHVSLEKVNSSTWWAQDLQIPSVTSRKQEAGRF